MLKRSSALASAPAFSGNGLSISEAPEFTLTQYAGTEKELKKVLGKIPSRVGVVLEQEGRTQLRINPMQIWLIGEPLQYKDGVSTPLSSSRTRILLEGENARAVLAKLAAIDFHSKHFKSGMFVSTAIHHTPVVILCTDKNTFHIYAMRTFALSVWEAVTDAALEFKE